MEPRPGYPRGARRNGACDCQRRVGAHSAARRRRRVERAVRPRIECHRRPPTLRSAHQVAPGVAAGRRGQAALAVPDRSRPRRLRHPRTCGQTPAQRRTVRTITHRLPRRRERHEQTDADRGHPPASHHIDAHRLRGPHPARTGCAVVLARAVEQPRRELPRAPACYNTRHDGDDGASAGAETCNRITGLCAPCRAGARS
jgi:hypothetical protein